MQTLKIMFLCIWYPLAMFLVFFIAKVITGTWWAGFAPFIVLSLIEWWRARERKLMAEAVAISMHTYEELMGDAIEEELNPRPYRSDQAVDLDIEPQA